MHRLTRRLPCRQDLLTCCWLPSAAQTAHVHGDALLAVGGKDSCVSVISLASCAVVRLLKGHTQASHAVLCMPVVTLTDSVPPFHSPWLTSQPQQAGATTRSRRRRFMACACLLLRCSRADVRACPRPRLVASVARDGMVRGSDCPGPSAVAHR